MSVFSIFRTTANLITNYLRTVQQETPDSISQLYYTYGTYNEEGTTNEPDVNPMHEIHADAAD